MNIHLRSEKGSAAVTAPMHLEYPDNNKATSNCVGRCFVVVWICALMTALQVDECQLVILSELLAFCGFWE